MQKDSNTEYEKLFYSYMSQDHKYSMVLTLYVSFLVQKTSITSVYNLSVLWNKSEASEVDSTRLQCVGPVTQINASK